MTPRVLFFDESLSKLDAVVVVVPDPSVALILTDP